MALDAICLQAIVEELRPQLLGLRIDKVQQPAKDMVILLLRAPIINYYEVSAEAKAIAWDLMDAITMIIIFQSMNSILTKGVLRAGGDTKFLMAGDILFLWVASIPLGYLAGLVFHWSSFWIYTMLKIDQIIKCVWCYFRLRSGKWLKKIKKAGE